MKKLLTAASVVFTLLVTLIVLSSLTTTPALASAKHKVTHTSRSTNWSCNDTNPLVVSPGNNSWYHVLSCIKEDSVGNVIAQVRAFHSSGPVYTKFCQITVDIFAHNAAWFDNDLYLTTSPWKQYQHCGTQLSETVTYPWQEALTNGYLVYIAGAHMTSTTGGTSYSHYLRYNR